MTPAEEQLSAYLDDELDAAQRAHVESLLQHDGELRKTLEKLRQVRRWMGELSRPSLATSKPISELLAESSYPVSPSLNVQGDGRQQSRWFASDWRWPAGLVTAAAIMLSILAMWPTGESQNVAFSTNSQSDDSLAAPKSVESANSFKTDAIADASQATDALPADAKLAEGQRAEGMPANAAVLESAAQDATASENTASENTPAANRSELLMAKGLGGDLPAEAEMAGDLKLQANALAANDLPAEGLSRQAGTAEIENVGEMQARVASRDAAGGQGGLGGVGMGSPSPSAPTAMSRVPNSPAPGTPSSGTAASSGAPGLAASAPGSAPSSAPGRAAPSKDATGNPGYLEETGSLRKSMDSSRFADASAKPSDKSRPNSRPESLEGLGGGGLGGSAGAMAAPPNRSLSSALEEGQEKAKQADRSGFSRIYLERLGERSPKEEDFPGSRGLEVTGERFEKLLREVGEGVAPELVKVYWIPAANREVVSNWKEGRMGGIEEFVLRNPESLTRQEADSNSPRDSVNRESKKQSFDISEDLVETWILLKVTPDSWADLAVKLDRTGGGLREIDPSTVNLPEGLSLSQVKAESTEQATEKDQRILILVNLR